MLRSFGRGFLSSNVTRNSCCTSNGCDNIGINTFNRSSISLIFWLGRFSGLRSPQSRSNQRLILADVLVRLIVLSTVPEESMLPQLKKPKRFLAADNDDDRSDRTEGLGEDARLPGGDLRSRITRGLL
jgi:hypothetical protein